MKNMKCEKEKIIFINDTLLPLFFREKNVSKQMLIEIWLADNLIIDIENFTKNVREENVEKWREYII